MLLAATAAFTPLALSAALFLRLPPTAPALAPLGWPAGALRQAHSILLEPDARQAWLVAAERPSAAPASAPVACRFELATLRPSRCHELELRPRGARNALHHAFGEGSLLLVASEGVERGPLALRAVLLRPGARPMVGAPWAEAGDASPPAALVNVAWNAGARRFEAYLSRPNAGGGYDLFVLPFAAADAAPAPEPLPRAGGPLAPGAAPLAVAATSPRGVLWATADEAFYEQGERRTTLPCRDSPAVCALVASPLAPTGHYAGSGSLWFDGRGEIKPLAPHFDASERWRQIVHVAERLADDGGSSPLASRSAPDDRTLGRVEASDLEGAPLSLVVERRGLEEVLVVSGPEGARRRVARDAHAPYNWTAVPHAGGLALIDFSAGRGVALDASFGPLAPTARAAALRALLAERFERGPASVVALLVALAAYPLLALWAALARGDGRALGVALGAYVALAAALLMQNHAALFPP